MPLGSHLLRYLLDGAYDVEVVFAPAMEFTGKPGASRSLHPPMKVRIAFASAMRMREPQ
ncbi:MAG: hypothetical protein R3D34_04970 [Nitratireductor sp.]